MSSLPNKSLLERALLYPLPPCHPMPSQGDIPPNVDAASVVEAHLGATPRIGHNSEGGGNSVLSPLLEATPSNGMEERERGRVDFRSVSFGYPTRPGETPEAVEATVAAEAIEAPEAAEAAETSITTEAAEVVVMDAVVFACCCCI